MHQMNYLPLLTSVICIAVLAAGTCVHERCGAANNSASCPTGRCCSKYGYCGDTEDFCLDGCQSTFGKCGMETSSAPVLKSTPAPLLKCGPNNNGAKCPDNQCCSSQGFCGTGPEFCQLPVSTDGGCGPVFGTRCPDGFCCSKFGFCGATSLHCGDNCQSLYGSCPGTQAPTQSKPDSIPATLAPVQTKPAPESVIPTLAPTPAPVLNNYPESTDGSCGIGAQKRCPSGYCCSKFGFCGKSSTHCLTGCQSDFGICQEVTQAPLSFCGIKNGNKSCPIGLCCGSDGRCGVGDGFCASPSCQPQFGSCNLAPLPVAEPKKFARFFSPYVLVEVAFTNYAVVAQQFNVPMMTMAFVIANNGAPSWGYSWRADGSDPDDKVMQQIKALRKIGADAIASFGGAAGDELAVVIQSDIALLNAYQSVVSGYNFKFLDFDIEGSSLADVATNRRRNRVLAQLQRNNPDVLLSFTLPVMPSGLTDIGLNMLRDAHSAGVRIDAVNIMAMDYGPGGIDMGQAAIDAIRSTQAQLKQINLNSCVGVIPMIGVNDVEQEVFSQVDALKLLAYASDPSSGVCMTSFWSLDRDNSQYTRIAQTPFEFTKIFAAV